MLHLVCRELVSEFPVSRVLFALEDNGEFALYQEDIPILEDVTPVLFELELDAINAALVEYNLVLEVLSPEDLEPCDSMLHTMGKFKLHRLCTEFKVALPNGSAYAV